MERACVSWPNPTRAWTTGGLLGLPACVATQQPQPPNLLNAQSFQTRHGLLLNFLDPGARHCEEISECVESMETGPLGGFQGGLKGVRTQKGFKHPFEKGRGSQGDGSRGVFFPETPRRPPRRPLPPPETHPLSPETPTSPLPETPPILPRGQYFSVVWTLFSGSWMYF